MRPNTPNQAARPGRPTLPGGLYAIADAGFGDPVALGAALFDAGCAVVQLRCKGWPAAQVETAARALLPLAQAASGLLIINDHLEVALRTGAHGLHLGAQDGTLAHARAALPAQTLLGASTRGLTDIEAAAPFVDYVGFGPVFATDTRPGLPEPRGLLRLAEAVATAPCPVVAIGGINAENLDSVIATRCRGWAVISAILRARDVSAAARVFQR